MTDQQRSGRIKLILLAIVFLGPLALAFALYYTDSSLIPTATTENGELLTPVPLSDAPLAATPEAPLFRGKWSIVYLDHAGCDEDCQRHLYETRQVRRSLGKEMDRVQRVLIVTDGAPDLEWLAQEHPDLIVAGAGETAAGELLQAIADDETGDVYVVDPIGNLMMRFPPDLEMKAIKSDLVHLLKVSRIG